MLVHQLFDGRVFVSYLGRRSDYLATGPIGLRFAGPPGNPEMTHLSLDELMPKKAEETPPEAAAPEKPADVKEAPPAVADDAAKSKTITIDTKSTPVAISPEYRLNPDEVVQYFKDDHLEGLNGSTPYTGVKLRFEPALPQGPAAASSEATYRQK